MQKTITHTDEQLETIKTALRFQFDDRKTHHLTQIELMEAMENINNEAFEEMKSDLLIDGIIKE
jgi:hypothetical protein